MHHVEMFLTTKDIIKAINNYNPYTYRVLFKDKTYSKWGKPKHSFIEVNVEQWTDGNHYYTYENTIGIEFRIHKSIGKESYFFQLKIME